MTENGIGVFVRLVDANGKTAEEVAGLYKESSEYDPLGRVAFCTDAEVEPELADRFEKIVLAYPMGWDEYGYLAGDVKKVEIAHDPNARKGFKRKIMGSFSDLLPKELDREMKNTWILIDNVHELDPDTMTGKQCKVRDGAMEPESLLKDVEKNVYFTYFI